MSGDISGEPTIFDWERLPIDFVEAIVRMLVNHRKYEFVHPGRNSDTMLIPYIQDILSLRVTCPYLLNVVNSTRLRLKCVLKTCPSFRNWEHLNDVLKFMQEGCNWKFSTLQIDSCSLEYFDEIEPVLRNYRALYTLFVRVDIGIPLNMNLHAVEEFFGWLRVREFKLNFDFSCDTQKAPPINFVEQTLVRELHINMLGDDTAWEYIPRSIKKTFLDYSNLTQLELTSSFNVEDVKLFPNLRKLSVKDLRSETPNHERRKVTELSISFTSWKNLEDFSEILYLCFPRLVYFSICSGLGSRDIPEGEMFSLPTACITLKTDSHFLPYFAKCSSVVYVDLLIVDYYPAKSPLYDKAIVPSLNLRAMILKFTRKDEYSNINIWKSIVNAVKGMKSLKVLSVYVSEFSMSSACYDPNEPGQDIDKIRLLFKGEATSNDVHCNELILRIKELCRNQKLKLLVLGKTVFYKMTDDAELFAEINMLEEYGWSVKRGCSNWMSLEF
ncbi:uncharacterized protein LOC142348389 isoform X2 [Convolutriloba macropyga]|uniref:uncharacterized protein LOC142348389 isoform X2 n=1 Tax=Convolutriloba macropyga TaxID=536237 RepID=UPI003F51D1E0